MAELAERCTVKPSFWMRFVWSKHREMRPHISVCIGEGLFILLMKALQFGNMYVDSLEKGDIEESHLS